ncbi:MAG: thiamine pyrophosphate-requiring protein [Rhodospirillales bacterium]|jgi:acetolactate synthase-1/2/3 large subunit|nr:thiamine pyrophosphate-requiring protein [Rhodospirillales bacterium]MBT4006160.1 thiamine pyrophosphate-requiring protein [Rhodospirillales bacterium]MBT5076958.1 thiamine pyrophosphate-requiring protein [Rhodospirillales bacterium]MBT5114341.1 thiamine pyrophosphate-requiring protein [Rhodospirillales bacterium]MBT5672733.1 thiamine pyrophosphate-requiring protein [Rhodospirillales bacterium]
MAKKKISNGVVADAYLTLLADRGVDYLFGNAGTDFAPLIESYSKMRANGTKVPEPITCPHENVAMGMAQGYYVMTGRPQTVMVHVNVGTANAVCGLVNAYKGNIPVLFSAGRTPFSETGDLMGKRSGEIHWPQEMFDQRSMVREVVKWDYELPNAEVVETAIDRALNAAMTHPRGPVYMTLPREVLAGPAGDFVYDSPSTRAYPTAPMPDPNAIDEAANLIAGAKNPVIITSAAGADFEDVAALSALANRFAIPVTQRKPRYVCITTDDPMNLGYNPDAFLEDADLIIVADCDVPWIPGNKSPSDDCKVIHLGADPLFSTYPIRGFRSDMAITGLLKWTFKALDDALAGHEKSAKSRIDARRKSLGDLRAKQAENKKVALEKASKDSPAHPVWISHCIDQVKDDDGIVVKESQLPPQHMTFNKPGTFFSLGQGGGLGWGLGTALGIKLADRDRQVICTQGDGAYMFGNPIPAHYISAAENLPMLTIVYNNSMWNAVKRNTHGVYPDGYAAKSNWEPLTYFQEGAKFEKAVEIAGGYGERVEDPADLPMALDRALNAMAKDGRQALLNVVSKNA